jgi:hypothetical protein
MYQIFADSAYVIHDKNFTAFCKPHLTNLPPDTAFELETLRLQLEEKEKAPYRPIYKDALPDPTKPTFKSVLQRQPPAQLKPREQWMRDPPPIMSDKEADDLYYAGLAWIFGTSAPARQGTDADGHTFMVGSEPTDADMKREPSENTSASAPILQATPHRFTDIRSPTHPKHAESQLLRGRILLALRTRRYLKAFKRKDIPPVSMCPTSHATITTLLDKQDIVERDIDRLLETYPGRILFRPISPD